MKKKILILTILVIIFITAVGIYLNKTLILNKIKTEILKNIQTQISRTVSVDKVEYKIFKGFVITGLQISEKSFNATRPFLKAEQISFNPILFPFIFKRNIMIPSIYVNSLSVNVIRLKKNKWNFSDLIEAIISRPKTKSKFSITVLKVKLNDSKVYFQDKTLTKTFSKKLINLNLILKLTLAKKIKFDLTTNVNDIDTQLAINGEVDLSTKSLESLIKIKNLLITDYVDYFKKLPITVNGGIFSSDLSANFREHKLYLEGSSSIKDLDATKNKVRILANLVSDYIFTYDLKNLHKPLDYRIQINISNAMILGFKYLKEIKDIKGKINIIPDKLIAKEIIGKFLNEALRFSGSLENFRDPYFETQINANPSVSMLKEIFKDKIDLTALEIDGDSDIQLYLKGKVKEPTLWQIQGKLQISNGTFNAKKLSKKISNIQADIIFDRNKISWTKLIGDFGGKKLISNGNVTNFINPTVQFNLSLDSLNLETKFSIKDKTLQLAKLNGSYLDSQFDINGNIDISKKDNPLLSLKANTKIEVKDLSNLNPKLKEIIDKIKLSGLLYAQAQLNGRLEDYRKWQLILNANSPLLSIYDLKINDVKLNYAREGYSLSNLQLSGKPYGGKLFLKSQIDFSNQNTPFISNLVINDVDISKLKNDTKLKNKQITGTLRAAVNLKGSIKDIKDSLNGQGKLILENGNLWELELFKGIGKLLLIPEFQKIVFKKAYGDFQISNSKISTDNFILESEPINILFEGYLDFASNIDFDVTIQLTQSLIDSITNIKGILTMLLAQSTNAVTIRLTGNLKKPKYKILPIPKKIFEKAKDFIFEDVIKGTIGDILK
jgi:hypothetical protein